MKFFVELSGDDLGRNKEMLERGGEIDSAAVAECQEIFSRTFKKELCPACRGAELGANHVSSYNVISKRCPKCGYVTGTSLGKK